MEAGYLRFTTRFPGPARPLCVRLAQAKNESLSVFQRTQLAEAPTGSTSGNEQTASQAPAPRILVVDDETLIADTIVQILNRNGFIAEAAYSGAQAIELAKPSLPGARAFRRDDAPRGRRRGRHPDPRACPDTRIVLFSGQAATVEILARARQRGHEFELLPKPIHPTQLIKHLRQ